MGDSEWQEVTRKKSSSVFHRLKFPSNKVSMVDDLAKISLTVYVSNFPSHLTVRELWNICGKAGTLVDVYIANRKNNLGQMFAFCRFIKVSPYFKKVVSRAYVPKVAPQAINNVSKGSFCNNASSYVNVAKRSNPPKVALDVKEGSVPVITLKHDKPCDFPLAILGCFKDFCFIANTRNLCRGEGFMDLDFKYLGGLWVLFDFNSLEARNNFLKHKGISTWKWGELLFMDDSDGCNRLSKSVCIKSSYALLVFATIMVSMNDVNYAIKLRELCSWTPSFTNDDSESDVEDSKENLDSDNEKNSVDSDAESVADLFA
ncbi:reverse transcriptase domain, reverse transcriptase zinc-binding domain protein, partial [Tanacetum coccineum]